MNDNHNNLNPNKENEKTSFSVEEKKLLKKYLEEFKELYQKILILSPSEFLLNLKKGTEISIRSKNYKLTEKNHNLVQKYIFHNIYQNNYKQAQMIKKIILNRNKYELSNNYFNEEIIPHCEKDKIDGFNTHTCGEKFQVYKNNEETILYCIKCNMIYESSLIKFKCSESGIYFYSKIINKDNNDNNMPYSTWSKYHCNAVINDIMKCQICSNYLYFMKNDGGEYIFCKICKKKWETSELEWTCILCKKKFISKAKPYNPLEFKELKLCVKEALMNKIKAKPKYLNCPCNFDFSHINFIHKKSCEGELYIGELNGKKSVICNKCNSIGLYEGYIWTCPICYTKTKSDDDQNLFNKNEGGGHQKMEENENLRGGSDKNIIKNRLVKQKSNNKIEEYSRKYKTNLSINSKNNIDIQRKENKSSIKSNSNKEGGLKETKSFTTLEFGIANLKEKEVENLYNRFEKKININIKLSAMDYFRPSKRLLLLKNYEDGQKKNLEEEEDRGIKRKNSFIANFNLLKKNHSRIKADNNLQIQNQNKSQNCIKELKKNLFKNENKQLNLLKKELTKDEYISYFKKNNEQDKNYIKPNELISLKKTSSLNENDDNKNEEPIQNINNDLKNDNFYNDKYNNKKGSNSTAADSDNPSKIIYHGKNPRQSFQIKKSKKYNQFNLDDYRIIKKIGLGSFGQIFLIEDKYGSKFAMKKIIANTEIDIKKIENEYQTLMELNIKDNYNLIKIYNYISKKLDPTTYVIYVLMELAKTDWEREILTRKKDKNYYSEVELMTILSSLINTFAELQKQNISHRDIKPQNILVFNNGVYKLADFGEAKQLYKDLTPTNKQTLRGTELYMSPILFSALRSNKGIKYINHNTYKSDVFSFGLCALFAATLSFEIIYNVRELNNNVSIHVVIEKYLSKRYSYDIINFISNMLDINETTRKDFIEIQKDFKDIGYI